jgi:lactoylglutathione lyase
MQYLHTMVRIKNLEESLDFYCQKLGLVEYHRYDSEAGAFTNIFLHAPGDTDAAKTKSPVLELTYNWPNEDGATEDYTAGRNFGHLAYQVDNIYETCQKLMDAGVTINRPPRDGRMAFIKSPDGISIELLQVGDPLETREPWASMPNTGNW